MRIIALFNLKPGVEPAAYEAWARTTDIPNVRILGSVKDFQVYRVTGLLGTDAPAPYAYAEVIDIGPMEDFMTDIARDAMQRVAREFATYADPVFLLTEQVAP